MPTSGLIPSHQFLRRKRPCGRLFHPWVTLALLLVGGSLQLSAETGPEDFFKIERHREWVPVEQHHVPPQHAPPSPRKNSAASGPRLTAQMIDGPSEKGMFGHSVAGAGDIDGDGFDDVIVSGHSIGGNGMGAVLVCFGAAGGLDPSRDWWFHNTEFATGFGHQVAGIGDVNADGFADIAFGITTRIRDGGTGNTGFAVAFLGSPAGLGAQQDWEAFEDSPETALGFSIAAAGDVNGDGYDDVIVGAPGYRNDGAPDAFFGRGRVLLYLGGPDGLSREPVWSAGEGRESFGFGWSVSGAGDLNGDGYADLVVGYPQYSTSLPSVGRAYVYYGGPDGPSTTADWTITGTQEGQQVGLSVHAAGDVNGDGLDDLVIAGNETSNGQDKEGVVLVFHGSPRGLGLQPAWAFEPNQVNFLLGHSVASAGDVNGDGYGDLVMGAFYGEQVQADEGLAIVVHGSRRGLAALPAWTARGGARHSGFGATVRSAGDVNGDGFMDVIVGQPFFTGEINGQGRAVLYFGSPKGLADGSFWRPAGERFGFELRSVLLPFPNQAWTLGLTAALLAGVFWLTRWHYLRRERLAALAQSVRDAALREERQRISQDLHDQLGAHLTGLALRSGSLRRTLDRREPRMAGELSKIETTAGELVDHLAEIVWLTRPANDSLEQLVNYLLDHAGQALEPAGVTCRFDVPVSLPDIHLEYDLRHDLLLCVKETLHNVVKHAKASQVTLSMRLFAGRMEFAIQDNGGGLSSGTNNGRGNGLRNLRERMRRHGGQFDFESSLRGTLVRLVIPLPRPPAP